MYAVVKGSQSGHCCFEATVVDLTKPDILPDGRHFKDDNGRYRYEAICECFTPEDAATVCAALNSAVAPAS